MKVSRLLLATEGFMGLLLALYMTAHPIFPEIASADFSSHLALSRDIAHGIFPSLSSALLYYGVEFYLAIPQYLFPDGNPLFLIRLSMALLVFISPMSVYLCAKEVFGDSFRAKMSALVYTLTGWIWVEWVLVTGLYANFYGFLASLLLVAATIRFEREKASLSALGLLILALVNALFSHYTTLLVFPILMGYLLYKRNFAGFAVFAVPLAAGIVIDPNIIATLLNFLAPTTVVSPGSSVLPGFALSALDAELTDLEFAFLMLGALAFAYYTFKKKDSKMLVLLAWFILPLVIAPLNSSAWRFAFISLVPGTLMLGYVLSLIPKFPLTTRRGAVHKNFYRTLLLVGLLVSPTFYPSWGFLALTHSLQADPQQGIYDAMIWLGNSPYRVNQVCSSEPQQPLCPHMVSVDDWRMTYSPLFGGPLTFYAPDYGVLWQDPLQMQLFALHHNSSYIAVVKDGTLALPQCDPRYSFGLTLSADMIEARPNQTVTLTLGAIKGLNATVNLFDNGASAAQVRLIDGKATVQATWPKAGAHSLVVALGTTATAPLGVFVDEYPYLLSPYDPSPPGQVPLDFCQPFSLYNQATMQGWSVIYANDEVAIWRYG